jgi:hypothetical protein
MVGFAARLSGVRGTESVFQPSIRALEGDIPGGFGKIATFGALSRENVAHNHLAGIINSR